MAAGSSSKEVIVNFRVNMDGGNAGAVRNIGAQAKKTQEEMTQSARKGMSDREKFFAEEQSKYEAAAKRGNERATREEEKGIKDRTNAMKRGIEERMRNEERAGAAAERAARMREAADRRVMMGVARVSGSVLNLARDFAMLGVLGEKDSQKLLEGLLRIGIGFDILKGGIHLIEQVSKMWGAVAASTRAAAASQAAYNVLSGAGGAGKVVGGGAAGMAAAGLATTGTASVAAWAGLGAGGLMLGGIGLEAGMNAFGNYPKPGTARSSAWDTVATAYSHVPVANWGNGPYAKLAQTRERLEAMQKETSAREAVAAQMRQIQEIHDHADSATQSARFMSGGSRSGLAGLGMTGAGRDLAISNRQVAFAGSESAAAGREVAGAGALERTGALDRQREALTYLRQAEEGRATAAAGYVQEQARALQLMRDQKQSMQGMAERFLDMTPEQRAMLNRSLGKLDAGQNLTAEDRQALNSIGSRTVAERTGAASLRQAQGNDTFRRLQDEEAKRNREELPQGAKNFDEVAANLKQVGVAIDKNMSDQKIAKALTDGLTAIQDATTKKLDAITQQVVKIMREQADRAENEAAYALAKQIPDKR